MERPEEEAREHVIARVRDALAADPDIGELELHIGLVGDDLTVTGNVGTPARRDAISRILHDLLPNHRLDNRTTVPPLSEPKDAERLS